MAATRTEQPEAGQPGAEQPGAEEGSRGGRDARAAQDGRQGRLTREQSRAQTRERLLDAARDVFARSGFHGASVDEIASAASYSTGALYSNFDGKEDLFLALMEREIDEHA